jgi:uncharacterized membrane protein (Fun14 family)
LPVEDFLFSAGGGFLFGAIAGYAIKKVMKIAAVVGLAYLSYKGWVDAKWSEIENDTMTTLSTVEGQIEHALNDTISQYATHSSAVAVSGLTLAAGIGFVPGLVIGFKRG